MSLSDLNDKEKNVVYECLKAVVYGPFIPDSDFNIIFGIDRKDIEHILKQWPAIDESEITTRLAINNSMNNICGYPINGSTNWDEWFSVTIEEVSRTFEKWKYGLS